jgi:hypothetical protein
MQSASYERKVGDWFFRELVVLFRGAVFEMKKAGRSVWKELAGMSSSVMCTGWTARPVPSAGCSRLGRHDAS